VLHIATTILYGIYEIKEYEVNIMGRVSFIVLPTDVTSIHEKQGA
jgi:hypothetical protein